MASLVCVTVLDMVDGPIDADVVGDIKKMEGCLAVFHGQKKEDEDISVLCTRKSNCHSLLVLMTGEYRH